MLFLNMFNIFLHKTTDLDISGRLKFVKSGCLCTHRTPDSTEQENYCIAANSGLEVTEY